MAQQQNKKAATNAVDALKIMVGTQSLLIPMSAVGEVVRGIKVTTRKNDPEWLHGWLEWRDVTIPLVAFEQMAGGEKSAHGGIVNALVVNTLGRAKGLDFYALLLTDLPQPARVSSDSDLETLPADKKKNNYCLMNVSLNGTQSVIPNLEEVEKFLRASL